MAKKVKHPTSVRLSAKAKAILDVLTAQDDRSESYIIEKLLIEEGERQSIKVDVE